MLHKHTFVNKARIAVPIVYQRRISLCFSMCSCMIYNSTCCVAASVLALESKIIQSHFSLAQFGGVLFLNLNAYSNTNATTAKTRALTISSKYCIIFLPSRTCKDAQHFRYYIMICINKYQIISHLISHSWSFQMINTCGNSSCSSENRTIIVLDIQMCSQIDWKEVRPVIFLHHARDTFNMWDALNPNLCMN